MTHVLIVDDHQIVRRGLKEILNDEFSGLETREAENGQKALELIAAQDWDIVLLDLNIPDRNGFEVLAEIKRLRPKTPVLMVSASPEEEFAIQALKHGASGYLNKGGAADELLIAVKRAAAGRKYVTASLAEKLAATFGSHLQLAPHENLSNRELQVLRMTATGKSIKDISAELAVSEKTVGTYRTRISKKMGLSTSVELTRYALKHHLVD